MTFLPRLIIIFLIFTPYLSYPSELKGDLNTDYEIDLTDVILSLGVNSGRSGITIRSSIPKADVNGDNRIGLTETVYLLQIVANSRAEEWFPSANDSFVEMESNTTLNSKLNADDKDSTNLFFEIATFPSKGQLLITNFSMGLYQYTPNQDVIGTDQFTFYVSDGENLSNIATVEITIKPPSTTN